MQIHIIWTCFLGRKKIFLCEFISSQGYSEVYRNENNMSTSWSAQYTVMSIFSRNVVISFQFSPSGLCFGFSCFKLLNLEKEKSPNWLISKGPRALFLSKNYRRNVFILRQRQQKQLLQLRHKKGVSSFFD